MFIVQATGLSLLKKYFGIGKLYRFSIWQFWHWYLPWLMDWAITNKNILYVAAMAKEPR